MRGAQPYARRTALCEAHNFMQDVPSYARRYALIKGWAVPTSGRFILHYAYLVLSHKNRFGFIRKRPEVRNHRSNGATYSP